jgi:hypothetical protein
VSETHISWIQNLRLRREIEQICQFNLFAKFPVEIGMNERAIRISEPQVFVLAIPGSHLWKVSMRDRVCKQIWILTVCHAQYVEVALGRKCVHVGKLR